MPDIDEIHLIYREKVGMRIISYGLASMILLLFGFGGIGLLNGGLAKSSAGVEQPATTVSTTFLSRIGMMMDTVYTHMPSYFEVHLDSQMMYLHHRDGTVRSIKVSTGTPRLKDGIETRTGIFLIQNKIRMLYSIQFDSTKVFNWLGFNWGIGFHSLEGRRYYWNLGRRRSSHGCIRLSTEDAEYLFETIEVGTPVIVHKGATARVISFLTDSTIIDTTSYTRDEVAAIYENRLTDLYLGNRLIRKYPNILLERKYIGHSGITIGEIEKVPERQRIPNFADIFSVSAQATTRVLEPKVKRMEGVTTPVDKERVEQVILP